MALRTPLKQPYQPLLLRLLHGAVGLLVLSAILTGYWVYNTYDGRFGRLPLPQVNDIQGIHGTFGLIFLLVFPAFAIYSFYAGQKRLIQPDSFSHLSRIGQPLWWISLHRISNTLMLIAAVLALISGRMMKEEWLPAGELNHRWYLLHLLAWSAMVICLVLHLLLSLKVGGVALLRSMIEWRVHPSDRSLKQVQQVLVETAQWLGRRIRRRRD